LPNIAPAPVSTTALPATRRNLAAILSRLLQFIHDFPDDSDLGSSRRPWC